MARYTVLRAAHAIRQARRLTLHAVIETGQGSGLLLSTQDGQPHVLGLGAVDPFGESIALGLSQEDVVTLRDALTDWLGG